MNDIVDDFSAALFGDAFAAADGIYTPQGGAAVTLAVEDGDGVILTKADETIDTFATGARRPATLALVPQSAIAVRPADGDSLTVGARTFTIRSAEPDAADSLWRLDLDETT